MSSATRVLAGLIAGALLGFALAYLAPDAAATASTLLRPVGRLWLNGLQMTIVPLVVALVIVGVNHASDAAASGRVARRAVLTFLAILVGATTFAALYAPAFLSLLPRDPTLAASLSAAAGGTPVAPAAALNFADWFGSLVPTNAIGAAAAGAIVPLVVFTLAFAFALTRIDAGRRTVIIDFFQGIADAMTVIVGWVLWLAPIGVFALILPVAANAGGGMLAALGGYLAMQCSMYLLAAVAMVGVVALFGAVPVARFVAAAAPAQAVAASTQSSVASLPAMLEAQEKLGCPRRVAALVLPLAVSLFRITSPIQYIGVSAFIAWAYGVDIGVAQWAFAIVLSVAISIGSAGLPGQATFMGMNLPVVQSLGLPIEPMGLLLAVELVPDVFATVGNVTADLAATSVVARGESDDDSPA